MGLRSYVTNLTRSLGGTIAAPYGGITYAMYDEWQPDRDAAYYLKNSLGVYVASRYRSQKLASLKLRFYTENTAGKQTDVTSHPAKDLFARVNPHWTGRRLFEMSELSLCLWGETFWFLEYRNGQPFEIWWAHPDKVRPVPSRANYLSHFEYYPDGAGEPILFKREETFWARYPNPDNEYEGLSPLWSAMLAADVGYNAQKSNAKMFSQGMQLAGFVSPPSPDSWSLEQGKQIEESLHKRFSGANNAHRWAVLAREIKFSPLTLSPKDAEYVNALKLSFEDIGRAFGLSPDLLGGERTYANAAEARLAFWQDTMLPECEFFADEIREQILPRFRGGENLRCAFDVSGIDVLQEVENSKWDRWKEQIETGAKTINEYRELIGGTPVPWGDDYWKPATLEPVFASGPEIKAEADAKAAELASQLEQQPKALPPGEETPDAEPRSVTRAMAYGSPEHERHCRQWVRATERHEAAVAATTADLMRKQQRAVLARLKAERAQRDVAEIADDPFDKKRWVKQFRQDIRPILAEIVADVGQQAMDDLLLSGVFDVFDPNVTRFLMQRAQRFAVEVNDTTWTNLKTSLSEGLKAGETIPELAQRVESVMADRIRSSSTVIARTETIGAANGGTIESWRQTGVVAGKEWIAALDERTRSTHVDAHGQRVAIDDEFHVGGGSGPHPGAIGLASEDIQCRCSMIGIVDTEWQALNG